MKTAAALIVAMFALCAAPAIAQTGQAPVRAAPAADVSREAGQPLDERKAELKAQRDQRRYCLRETGSLLRPRHHADRCSAYGNVWTREDLARTGRLSLADALRTLDVSVR